MARNSHINFTDTGKMFFAVFLLRIVAVILVIFTLSIRPTLPAWMLEWWGRIAYPLLAYSVFSFLFYKKAATVLEKHPWLLYADLLISVGIIQIGGSWRSSYFGYTITSMILFTIVQGRMGAYISAAVLIVAAVVKDPSGGLSSMEVFFVSDWDMRMGAALIYTTAGAILGYFSALLKRIETLSRAEMEKTKIEANTQLALELHDGAKQMVNAILLKMNPLVKDVQSSQNAISEEIRWIWRGMNYLKNEMNQVMDTLRKGAGISPAVCAIMPLAEEEARIAEVMTGLSWSVTSECRELCIPFCCAMPFRRFLSEAMMNAWKHSGAVSGVIFLQHSGESAIITVTDMGIGFNPHDKIGGSTTGLSSLKYRAEELNGSVEIETAPGRGCSVVLTFPLLSSSGIISERHDKVKETGNKLPHNL